MSEQEQLGIEDTYVFAVQRAFDIHRIERQLERGELAASTTLPPRAANALTEILSTVGPHSPTILKVALGEILFDTSEDPTRDV